MNPGPPDIIFKCPFCGGEVRAGSTPHPYAMHARPTCIRFNELEPDNFLKAVRLRLGVAAPWDAEAS